MKIVQKIDVLKEGNPDCGHLWMYGKSAISVTDLKHTQTRICSKCGRVEFRSSEVFLKTKFDYSSVYNHFYKEED